MLPYQNWGTSACSECVNDFATEVARLQTKGASICSPMAEPNISRAPEVLRFRYAHSL
jgi:hypothetical protein